MPKANITCTHCGTAYSSVNYTVVEGRFLGICPACQNDLAMTKLSERLSKLERKALRLRVTYQPDVEAMREALRVLAAKGDGRTLAALWASPEPPCEGVSMVTPSDNGPWSED